VAVRAVAQVTSVGVFHDQIYQLVTTARKCARLASNVSANISLIRVALAPVCHVSIVCSVIALTNQPQKV
jgi:hypothetical protein